MAGKHVDMSHAHVSAHDLGLCLGYGECPYCDYYRAVREHRGHDPHDASTHHPASVLAIEGEYECDVCRVISRLVDIHRAMVEKSVR